MNDELYMTPPDEYLRDIVESAQDPYHGCVAIYHGTAYIPFSFYVIKAPKIKSSIMKNKNKE